MHHDSDGRDAAFDALQRWAPPRWLAVELDAVTTKAAKAHEGVAPDAELHGYELFHGKADWEALGGKPRARIAVYRDVFAAIAAFAVRVIVRGVDGKRPIARYGDRADDPHSLVLQHLLEPIDECARAHGELALVIADELAQNDQQQHRDELSPVATHRAAHSTLLLLEAVDAQRPRTLAGSQAVREFPPAPLTIHDIATKSRGEDHFAGNRVYSVHKKSALLIDIVRRECICVSPAHTLVFRRGYCDLRA